MITKIRGEQPFQVLTNNFSISPSNEGYTLQISADGKNYSNLFTVGAGVTRLVTGVAANSYYRLSGNNSDVSVNWMKVCVTEGGGEGGSGTELEPITEFPVDVPEGTVVAYAGSASATGIYQYVDNEWVAAGVDDLSGYWTSAQTKDYVDEVIEDKELPIAAAVNDLKSNIEARLDQQFYKKKEVLDILKDYAAVSDLNNYTTTAGLTELLDAMNANMENKELAISAALNDLNARIQ